MKSSAESSIVPTVEKKVGLRISLKMLNNGHFVHEEGTAQCASQSWRSTRLSHAPNSGTIAVSRRLARGLDRRLFGLVMLAGWWLDFPMSLTRFSVSLDEDLVRQFDAKIDAEACPTRSKAVGDLIRASLVETEWSHGGEVAGAIVMVYDHHKPDLSRKLTAAQHDCHNVIISTQHVHLDHDNCLEIIAVRGTTKEIETLVKRLKSIKGLKHVSLAAGTTGRDLA